MKVGWTKVLSVTWNESTIGRKRECEQWKLRVGGTHDSKRRKEGELTGTLKAFLTSHQLLKDFLE